MDSIDSTSNRRNKKKGDEKETQTRDKNSIFLQMTKLKLVKMVKRICVSVVVVVVVAAAVLLLVVTIVLLVLSSNHCETNNNWLSNVFSLNVKAASTTLKVIKYHQQHILCTENGTKQIQKQQTRPKQKKNQKQTQQRIGSRLGKVRAIDILNQKYTYYNNNNNVDNTDDNNNNDNNDLYSDIEELYITQKLDHYNVANDKYTFQQRYFYSNRYVDKRKNNVQLSRSLLSSDLTNITQTGKEKSNNSTIRQIAFLCIGGEGPYLDKSVLYDSPHCTGDMLYTANEIMKNYSNNESSSTSNINIHLFALEHRYYGESYPQGPFPNDNNNDNDNNSDSYNNSNTSFSPVSNQHLIYLNSRQALVDIINFISHPYYNDYEWIVFGSSYPGVLSTWVRYHYPHLIIGSISNSAPIVAQLNMIQYNNHVSSVLQNPIVGGSSLCLQIYQNGHTQLSYAIQENSTNVGQLLNICTNSSSSSLDTIMNQHLLLGDGIIYPGTQENDPACTDSIYCNIAKKCSILVNYYNDNTTDPAVNTTNDHREMDSLVYLYNIIQQNEGRQQQQEEEQEQDTTAATSSSDNNDNDNQCVIVNWDETIQYISDPIRGQENGLRSWLWQTCTEFGFYQTCENNTNCPYSHGYHMLQQDLDICLLGFNISSNTVIDSIHDTNILNGGWTILQSGINNIASITGSSDPWTELALHEQQQQQTNSNSNSNTTISSTPAMPIYTVNGASHHYWTHPVQITDTPEIIAARTFIYQTVCQFLNI